MNATIYLFVGGILGLLVVLLMRVKSPLVIFINVGVGVIGAFLAGWIYTPLFGIHMANQSYFNLSALLVSLAGAAILLSVVNFMLWKGPRLEQ